MKILKYLGIGLLVFGAIFATLYFIKTNSKPLIEYDIQPPEPPVDIKTLFVIF